MELDKNVKALNKLLGCKKKYLIIKKKKANK